LLGESQDVGKRAHDGDLAVAARPAGQDFDSIDKRADSLDNLRACCFMLQRLLEFRYLFAIELRKIWVDRNVCPVLLGLQIGIDLSFASFQVPQVIAYGARISVAPCYEVEAAFNAALNILQLFQKTSFRSVLFLLKPGQFALELSRETVDESLIAKENIPEPV
jgi:hypothetical protein